MRKIIDASIINKKMSELAPSICFTDLESVFDLLSFEAEKIHYLVRRREFEAHVHYEADEMDLLGFYLDTGFNIGETEYGGNVRINMLIKSKELDPYFGGIEVGASVEKPTLAMTPYWRLLLSIIDAKKIQKWLEVSFILLNTAKEDQETFISEIEKLIKKIDMGDIEHEHNWISFISGPEERKYLIIGYPYQGITKEERNDIINSTLVQDDAIGTRGVVCIGIDLEHRERPYGVLASTLDTSLFVDLNSYGANINRSNDK